MYFTANHNIFDRRAQISENGDLYFYGENKFVSFRNGIRNEYFHECEFPEKNNFSIDYFNIIEKGEKFYIFCEERYVTAKKKNVWIKNKDAEEQDVMKLYIKLEPSEITAVYNIKLFLLYTSNNEVHQEVKFYLFENNYYTKEDLEKYVKSIGCIYHSGVVNEFQHPDKLVRNNNIYHGDELDRLKQEQIVNNISEKISPEISLLQDKEIILILLLLFKRKNIPKNLYNMIIQKMEIKFEK